MSAYLKFFELEQSPFEGKAQAQVVLGTRALRDALGTIQTGLADGVSRICVSGKQGLGKTSLARALPKLLGDSVRIALVLDPAMSWDSARAGLAKQWGLESGRLARGELLEAARDRRLVLVIDQAENASEEFLDHLDIILSYRSELDQPVVQSVLFARLATTEGEDPSPLVWWLDRIQTLQLEFAPLPRDGVESYIHKHLKRAGWRGERLFSDEAAHAIHGYTGGVPGEVSALCEKLLHEAAGQDLTSIDAAFVHGICDPSEPDQDEALQDGTWTLEDQFEDLALEDEFANAEADAAGEVEAQGAQAIVGEQRVNGGDDGDDGDERVVEDGDEEVDEEDTRSLAYALEHFRVEEDDGEDDTPSSATDDPHESSTDEHQNASPDSDADREDAAESEVDAAREADWPEEPTELIEPDPLYAPATEEELRAIRGSAFSVNVKTFVAAAIAAVLGGIGFALFSAEQEPPESDLSDSLSRTMNRPERVIQSKPRPIERTPPAITSPDDPKPMVMIQPGGGFVPVEVLEEAAGPRAEPSRAQTRWTPRGAKQSDEAIPDPIPERKSATRNDRRDAPSNAERDSAAPPAQPAAPAAPAKSPADLDTFSRERFW